MCAVLISGAVDRDFVINYIVVIYYILIRTTIGLDLRTSSTINGWIGLNLRTSIYGLRFTNFGLRTSYDLRTSSHHDTFTDFGSSRYVYELRRITLRSRTSSMSYKFEDSSVSEIRQVKDSSGSVICHCWQGSTYGTQRIV